MSINLSLFDAHFHIIDDRFPIVENNGYLPDSFSCEHYLTRMQGIKLVGGAVISGSFQAFDHSYIFDAIKQLGSKFVGVIQIDSNITDKEIIDLNEKGVRGIRFNFVRGIAPDIDDVVNLALRTYELASWHSELYIESKMLEGVYHKLIKLPAISIDHLGLTNKGFDVLLKLVSRNAKVKATGFGRVKFNVVDVLKKLYSENYDCLMFGTDLPSTRAPKPFNNSDFDLIINSFNTLAIDKILFKNAIQFYRV